VVLSPVDHDLRPQVAELVLERVLLGVERGVGELRDDDGREDAEDDHDDQDLDDREGGPAV
jgi:hypothetical protein